MGTQLCLLLLLGLHPLVGRYYDREGMSHFDTFYLQQSSGALNGGTSPSHRVLNGNHPTALELLGMFAGDLGPLTHRGIPPRAAPIV